MAAWLSYTYIDSDSGNEGSDLSLLVYHLPMQSLLSLYETSVRPRHSFLYRSCS